MPDIKSLTESLAKKRSELEKLQADLESARAKQFTTLPAQVGLQTIDELIKSLVPFASPRMKGLFNGASSTRPAKSTGASQPDARKTWKRKRARITQELRMKVITAIKGGDKTGAAISKEFGISVPSVANIKKAAGLTQKRGKK